ncbi:hypothetical protein J2X31_003429, partial [Flavobacterium arsenatis]|nr:hypothetical protein [Flavobacterium arsenatis]
MNKLCFIVLFNSSCYLIDLFNWSPKTNKVSFIRNPSSVTA